MSVPNPTPPASTSGPGPTVVRYSVRWRTEEEAVSPQTAASRAYVALVGAGHPDERRPVMEVASPAGAAWFDVTDPTVPVAAPPPGPWITDPTAFAALIGHPGLTLLAMTDTGPLFACTMDCSALLLPEFDGDVVYPDVLFRRDDGGCDWCASVPGTVEVPPVTPAT